MTRRKVWKEEELTGRKGWKGGKNGREQRLTGKAGRRKRLEGGRPGREEGLTSAVTVTSVPRCPPASSLIPFPGSPGS